MVLYPSMVYANYADLGEEVRALEEAGTNVFHCDIMDEGFAPNISMGLVDVKAVRVLTKKMVGIHLMIDHFADKIDWFLDAGADLIHIHPGSEPQVMKTLMCIRSKEKLSDLATNPDTSPSAVKELPPHCDYPLIVSVFSGFAEQTLIGSMDTKIRELIACRRMYDYRVILDGACSPAVTQECHALSVDDFVLGINVLSHGEGSYMENMNLLRPL